MASDPEDRVDGAITARAWFLGSRIDSRQLERGETLALAPLTLRPAGGGYAVVHRFGAVVFVGVDAIEQANFIEKLAPFVTGRFEEPETEDAEIRVDPQRGDGVDATGAIVLSELSVDRIQVAADALAKSAVLSHYEERVAGVFDRVELLAAQLGRGSPPARGRELMREIGSVLLIQARTVGRVEVTEKPEITWENPKLDRLFERLSAEYELRDRDVALSRKLELVAHTAQTYLNLLQDRQSIRLEWYIVLLIAVEIVLILYDVLVVR